MNTAYLIKRLHQVFDREQKERRNGGFGVPKPFKSIDDTLYGQVIEELESLSYENEVLRDTLETICSRLNEDGVNTTNIGADFLRGQELLNELGDDNE